MLRYVLDKIDEWLTIACLLLMLAGVATQVLSRIIPGLFAPWTEEFVRFIFAASVFFGMSVGIKHNDHISLTFLVDKLDPGKRRWFDLLSVVSFIIFVSLLGYLGWLMVRYYWVRGLKTSALQVNYAWVRASLVIGCALSLARLIQRFVQLIGQRRDLTCRF